MIRVLVALYFVQFKAVLRLYQKVYIYDVDIARKRFFFQSLHSVDIYCAYVALVIRVILGMITVS